MDASLSKYLDLLEPFIPKEIVNYEQFRTIHQITQSLPILSLGCLEFWFNESVNRIDFQICINSSIAEHRSALTYLSNQKLFRHPEFQHYFTGVFNFLKKWIKPNFILQSHIKYLWLSYDLTILNRPIYTPWFYVAFNHLPLILQSTKVHRIIVIILSHFGTWYSEEFRKELQQFFSNISKSLFVSAIGIQRNRGTETLRVYLTTSTFEEIFFFLDRFNWPGNIELLRRDLNEMGDNCSMFGLLVDLDPALQQQIGIELWFSPDMAHEGLKTLTSKLIELGLCTLEKAEAFLKWNGNFEIDNNPNIWNWPFDSPIPSTVTIHKFSRYIKIVYNPGSQMIAKGYLGFDRPGCNFDVFQ